MGKSWSDRESLDNSERREDGVRFCPLCGHKLWAEWGWSPGEPILCGGCGAHVKPVPFVAARSDGGQDD